MTMMTLPKFVPLLEAARDLGLTESELRERVEAGTIPAGVLPNGDIVVSETNIESNGQTEMTDINTRLRAIKREDFEHLRGYRLTIAEAEEKYSVPGTTLRDWVKREYVEVAKDGHPMLLDELTIAYCVAVYEVRQELGVLRVPLLGKTGKPYTLKRPRLAVYRRRKKRLLADT